MGITPKNILILSPESWGTMHISKHHYAIELAKLGNYVFFINPPKFNTNKYIQLERKSGVDGLFVLTYSIGFSTVLRFYFRIIFDIVMYFKIQKILRIIGKPIDIVWCFEPNLYSNLNWFKAKFNIYHPVDNIYYNYQRRVGKNAHLIISVTEKILKEFDNYKVPKIFINHGLAEVFFRVTPVYKSYSKYSQIKVGYSGNLLRNDIDIAIFRQIIDENPTVEFHIWGAYKINESNLGGEIISEKSIFLKYLQKLPNVYLYGAVDPDTLASGFQNMDAFLICYDICKEHVHANYHKILEYLSTGKVVISNFIQTYSSRSDLVTMNPNLLNNEDLPSLFKKVLNNLEIYNNLKSQKLRAEFARENTYKNHVLKIEKIIISYL